MLNNDQYDRLKNITIGILVVFIIVFVYLHWSTQHIKYKIDYSKSDSLLVIENTKLRNAYGRLRARTDADIRHLRNRLSGVYRNNSCDKLKKDYEHLKIRYNFYKHEYEQHK